MQARVLGWLYRVIRFSVVWMVMRWQGLWKKPLDLETAIDIGDTVLGALYRWHCPFMRYTIPQGIGVRVCGLYFPSPITIAAFKAEHDILSFWFAIGAGGVCCKTVQQHPTLGNPRPRIQDIIMEGQPALINSLGLPGPGIHALLSDLTTSPLAQFKRPIGISIYGQTIAAYVQLVQAITAAALPFPYYLEINLSCPNLKKTISHDSLHDSIVLDDLMQALRKTTCVPLSIKVSPDWPTHTVLDMIKTIKQFHHVMVTIGNSRYATCAAVGLANDRLSIGGGGITGWPLYNAMLARVQLVSSQGIPIIATGGISTYQQVQEVLQAGASLVGMATAVIQDPYCIVRINQQLACHHRHTTPPS